MLTDSDLDTLVAGTAPVADDDLTHIALHGLRPVPRHLRLRRIAAGALVAAALAIAAVLVASARDGDKAATAWAAPLVKLANDSPLILLDANGWKVTRADEYDSAPSKVVEGEMTFSAGARRADLHWRGGSLADWQKDRAHDAPLVTHRTVMGHRAQVVRYAQSDDYTALWADDDGRVLEFRTIAPSLDEFTSLLGALTRVDVDAWLSAMPASVIKTADRATAVRGMLADIETPPGFDAAKLEDGELLKDRYQLGAAVAGAVACAWIARWDAARKRGDDATAKAAADAMQRSRNWKILREMKKDGAYPDVLWQFADAMRGDGTWYGRPLIGDARSGLGCD